MEPEGSQPCSEEPVNKPYPELDHGVTPFLSDPLCPTLPPTTWYITLPHRRVSRTADGRPGLVCVHRPTVLDYHNTE